MAAELSPRGYLFGIIITMFFVIGGVSLIGMIKESNPSLDADDRAGEFNRTFNRIETVSSEVNVLESRIKTTDNNELGVFGVLNALIFSSWQTIRFMFDSFGFMDDVLFGLTKFFGVPAWIPLIVGMLITVMLVFAIYRMVLGSRL